MHKQKEFKLIKFIVFYILFSIYVVFFIYDDNEFYQMFKNEQKVESIKKVVFNKNEFLIENINTSSSKEEVLQDEKNIFLTKGLLFTNEKLILEVIYEKSIEYGLDPYLIVSLIMKESNFDINAKNRGAYGLTQITNFAYKEYINTNANINSKKLGFNGKNILFDIENNIEIGISYLKSKIIKYNGNLHYALMAYNGGDYYVKKFNKKNIHSTKYSHDIIITADALRK